MGLARDLVILEETLRSTGGVDLFAPVEHGGLLESPEAAGMLDRIREIDFHDPVLVLRLCLQALEVQHGELAPHSVKAEMVATLPPETPGIARPTEQVLREMLRPRVDEVILLGYELTDDSMVQMLADAASRGAKVIMICDRSRRSARRLLEAWPAGIQRLRIFQDRQRSDEAPYASMHAKCLLVNGADLLITSANFTFHGLHGNIEIGVRLSGVPAGEARNIFSHLVENRIVEEVF